MKIIFIGIHNKPNLQPLDSSTISGKRIDEVIGLLMQSGRLSPKSVIKTNLYNTDKFPSADDIDFYTVDFFKRIKVKKDDIAVFLGQHVYLTLNGILSCKKIRAAHPSLQWVNAEKRKRYSTDLAADIISSIKISYADK